MKQLSRKNHNQALRPIKILQFGEGNFLRAFVDDFIQVLNNEGLINTNIAVVQPVAFGRVKELSEQDGLYTLFLEGLQDGKIVKTNQIIDVISEFVNPYIEFNKYLNYAKSTDLEIIFSNTTEAGIVYEAENVLMDQVPNSFPGKLLRLLYERYTHFNGSTESGLEIVPCELIDDNGETLKNILAKLAEFNQLDKKFITWLTTANRYYNTLVDRIVPGYPANDAKELEKHLGYIDHSMVKGEVFALWVIQGPKELESKLPFAKSSLKDSCFYVESIVPYKQRKVKILNGSHTALVPISYLLGNRAVKESMQDPRVDKFVKGFIFDEVVPTIDLPKEQMDAFANSVIERYLNPFIHHLLMSIALNSVAKFKSRIVPTIEDFAKQGKFPKYSLFSLAALIKFYSGTDGNGVVIELADDKKILDKFSQVWSIKDPAVITKEILTWEFWESEYLASPMVVDFVTKALVKIDQEGMEVALAALFNGDLV